MGAWIETSRPVKTEQSIFLNAGLWPAFLLFYRFLLPPPPQMMMTMKKALRPVMAMTTTAATMMTTATAADDDHHLDDDHYEHPHTPIAVQVNIEIIRNVLSA